MDHDVEAFRASRHRSEVLVASWQDAEELAAWHMREHLWFRDATQTGDGPDGGLDVLATGAVAQVKHHSSPVGAPEIQRLVGAALTTPVKAFYALEGYTASAIAYAERAEVGLFSYDIYGNIEPHGTHARALLIRANAARGDTEVEVEKAERALEGLDSLAGALERALRQVEETQPTDTPAVYVCAEIAVQLAIALDVRPGPDALTSQHDALDAEIAYAINEGNPRPSEWIRRLHDWDIRRARIMAGDLTHYWVKLANLLSERGAIQRWPLSVGANMAYLKWRTWPQRQWITQEVADRLVQLDPLRRGEKWCQGAMWYVNYELAESSGDLNIRFYDDLVPDVGGWRELLELDEPLWSTDRRPTLGALWE